MKKLITLALAAAFVASSYAPASAVEVTVDARYQFQFQSASDGFATGANNTSSVGQRLRFGVTVAASEHLSGYVQLQAGPDAWGDATSNHGSQNLITRQVYMDWTIPTTDVKVRMGRQSISLPAFVTLSPVMDDMINGGIVVDAPICDKFGLTGFWTRPYHEGGSDISAAKLDVFGLVGNASFDSLNVSPWFVFAKKDKGAAGDSFQGNMAPALDDDGNIITSTDAQAEAFIFGFGSEWRPFDPFTVALDGAYGVVNYSDRGEGVTRNAEGWYLAAKAAYALDFGTPTLMGWYASGDSKGDMKNSGNLPALYGDFNATAMYFDNAFGYKGGNRCAIGGTWGVSAQLNGVSFVKDLAHDFSVTYIAGTNSKYNVGNKYGADDRFDYLTAEDSLVELGFLSTYKIYKNLTAAVDLSYIIEDFDTTYRSGAKYENAWAANLCFEYRF